MSRLFLKPAAGLRIRQADGRPWPAEGDFADDAEIYIQRRIAAGDLAAADPPADGPARGRNGKPEEAGR